MKLTAQELRIGNYVFLEKEPFTVTGLNQMFNDEPYEIQLKDSGGMFQDEYIEGISPIPLTEEWLLRFGFEFDLSTDCFHKQTKIGKEIIFNKNYFLMDIDFPVCTEYVHQLQNLFFALTGEELTVKELVS